MPHLPRRKPKNVFIIGETGAGKSTIVNTITNYFRDGSLDKLKVAIPTAFLEATESFDSAELSAHDRSSSQTTACTRYPLGDFVFIDTPGLNDTRGADQDQRNIIKIVEAAAKAGDITSLLFVLNGSRARFTLEMNNILAFVRGNFPDSVLSNVIVVLTNSTQSQANTDVDIFKKHFKKTTVFYMNNSAFSSDPKTWSASDKLLLEINWKLSMKTVKAIAQKLAKMPLIPTEDFSVVHDHRNAVNTSLNTYRRLVQHAHGLEKLISQSELSKRQHEEEMDEHKDYDGIKVVNVTELVPGSRYSVVCNTCQHVCHEGCGDTSGDERSSKQALLSCSVFCGSDRCLSCPGHCSFKDHSRAKLVMRNMPKTIMGACPDEKRLFDAAKAQYKTVCADIAKNKQQLSVAQTRMDTFTGILTEQASELQDVCSGFSLLSELTLAIGRLEMEARDVRSTDARLHLDVTMLGLRRLRAELEAGGAGEATGDVDGVVVVAKVEEDGVARVKAKQNKSKARHQDEGNRGGRNSNPNNHNHNNHSPGAAHPMHSAHTQYQPQYQSPVNHMHQQQYPHTPQYYPQHPQQYQQYPSSQFQQFQHQQQHQYQPQQQPQQQQQQQPAQLPPLHPKTASPHPKEAPKEVPVRAKTPPKADGAAKVADAKERSIFDSDSDTDEEEEEEEVKEERSGYRGGRGGAKTARGGGNRNNSSNTGPGPGPQRPHTKRSPPQALHEYRECSSCKLQWVFHPYDIRKHEAKPTVPLPRTCLICRGVNPRSMRKCEKCKMDFFYTAADVKFLKEKNFSFSKTCMPCYKASRKASS